MKTPAELFGELFIDLQLSNVVSDPKAISDAIPLLKPSKIKELYKNEKVQSDFDIHLFYKTYFRSIKTVDSTFKTNPDNTPEEHIEILWEALKRDADKPVVGESKIALPYPYIVPGGRFNEIYYWDSYFTMLGLKVSGKFDIIRSMIDNFAYLIDQFGHIPNGNRSYFLSRSQPPFFSMMIELIEQVDGDIVLLKYLPILEKEYSFWMDGSEDLVEENTAKKHTVLLEDNIILNRYFDSNSSPRAEMYSTDIELSETSNRNKEDLFSNLRAACESGWDFSSRWLVDENKLETIQTENIIPVDLNCLLYNLEKLLAKAYKLKQDKSREVEFEHKAKNRSENIDKYFWNDETGFYADYNYITKDVSSKIYASGVFPLFNKIADKSKAIKINNTVKDQLTARWGILTSTINSGQQWDAPNGWAPLQWVTFKGLQNYGFHQEANQIKEKWLGLNEEVFKRTGKFLEKYNVNSIEDAIGGGEYPVQDGFGWTNGVYLAMKNYV